MKLTYPIPAICMACKHLGVDTDPEIEAPDDVTPMSESCAAFPKGIPSEIYVDGGDHYEPIGGEVVVGGKPIVFELEPGDGYVLRNRETMRQMHAEIAVELRALGHVPPNEQAHEAAHEVQKFNPYHDAGGRFTSAEGDVTGSLPAGPKRGQPHAARRKPSTLGVTGEPNPVTGKVMTNTEFGDTMETLFRQRAGRQSGFKEMFGGRLRALVGQHGPRTGALDYRTTTFGIEVKSVNTRAKDKRVKISRRAAAAKAKEAERLRVRGGIVVQVVDFDRGSVTLYGWDKGFSNPSTKASPTSVNIQFNPTTQGAKLGEYRFTRAQWHKAQQETTRMDARGQQKGTWGDYDAPDTMGKMDDLAWRAELRKARDEANSLPRPDSVQRLMKEREAPMTDEDERIEAGDTVIQLVEQEGKWVPHFYEAE